VTAALPSRYPAARLPAIETEAVPQCPVCGAGRATPFAFGADYELETCANRWEFVQCGGCGHVRLSPRPAVETLPVIYPPRYYAYNYEQQIHPIARRGKAWLDRRKLGSIVRHLDRAPRAYLDVGCGDGRFLRAMQARGVPADRLFGLELDESVAARLRREGYQVEQARVEDSTLVAPGSVDLVTLFHVIEHVDRPRVVIEKLATWLAPGGLLALETPNRASLDARLFRRTFWGGYHYPRHWQLFDTDGIRRLLVRAGLEIVAVRYQTGHSFWLYSFHHALKYGRISAPWLARRFDPLGALGSLVAATAVDKVRAALGFRTSAVLVLARRPDRPS
jgi:SAM-dependent methyltransferase